MKKIAALCIIFCFATASGVQAAGYFYSIDFSANGWMNPIEGEMKTNSDYDYLSPNYYCLYSYCNKKKKNYYQHVGVDIVSVLGQDVVSIASGEVYFLHTDISDQKDVKNTSRVYVRHKTTSGKIFTAVYGHCEPSSDIQKKYTDMAGYPINVMAGDPICKIKRFNSPDHLHFEIQEKEIVPEASWGILALGGDAYAAGWRNPNLFLVDNSPDLYSPDLYYFFQVEEKKTFGSITSSVSIGWYPHNKSCEQAKLWAYNGVPSYQYTKDICGKAYNELKSFNWKYFNKYWFDIFFGKKDIEPVCQ